MIELMFSDGTSVHGDSYREAEDALRAAQWQAYPSRRAFRREMRARANVWNDRVIKVTLPQTSKQFLTSMADANMCRIDKSTEGRLV